jgi:hypothetical protein
MGAPTSEVGYTSATTRRGGPRSLYGHVVALVKKIHDNNKWYWTYSQSGNYLVCESFITLQNKANPNPPIKVNRASLSNACLQNSSEIKVYEKCRRSTISRKGKTGKRKNKKLEEERRTTDFFISFERIMLDSLFHKKASPEAIWLDLKVHSFYPSAHTPSLRIAHSPTRDEFQCSYLW